MLEAGATEVYPSFRGAPVVRARRDLATLQGTFAVARASVMTVHLCSTVPMGEDDRARPPTASGWCTAPTNVYVNDASLLPDAPGRQPAGVGDGAGHPQRPALPRHAPGGPVTDRAPTTLDPPDVTVVTGAAGWLGRALVDRLADADGPHRRPGASARSCTAAEDAAALARAARRRAGRSATSADPTGSTALFAGLPTGGTVDVIHAAGVIHPARRRRLRRGQRPRHRQRRRRRPRAPACGASSTCRRTARSAPTRTARDVFRNDEPYHPYLRLRPLEDAGRAARARRGRAAASTP